KPMFRVIAEQDDVVVGYGRTCLIAPNARRSFASEVIVHPKAQRQGIGRAVFKEIERYARENGAQCTTLVVFDRIADTKPAIERLGYEEKTFYFQSSLDPRTFDVTEHNGVIARVCESGIQIRALSEFPATEQTDRAFHAVVHETELDVPFLDYFGVLGFDDYRKMMMGAQWFDRSGAFVAMHGEKIVGVTLVNPGSVDFNGEMFVSHTGVVDGYRGKGIATALKARALEWAKAFGGTKVRTENNTANPAMRAVNQRLGFADTGGQWLMVKELA
ncbi:MAG TPA: GNAT family N-acetyltransferase, partial [Fimbriimonadaceae bacterium]|nr:GNAT family N-acetyltransferase [Fimbriimonadaceae bacterium]